MNKYTNSTQINANHNPNYSICINLAIHQDICNNISYGTHHAGRYITRNQKCTWGIYLWGIRNWVFLSAFEVGLTEPSPIPTADLTLSSTSSGTVPSELTFLLIRG